MTRRAFQEFPERPSRPAVAGRHSPLPTGPLLVPAALIPLSDDPRLKALRDPRQLLRWGYVLRLWLGGTVLFATGWSRQPTDARDLALAAAMALGAMVVTAVAVWWNEIARRPATSTFLYLLTVFDLLLVTTVVHLSGGASSPFAALYILVIATGSLLLPVRSALLVTGLAVALHLADATFGRATLPGGSALWLQLLVFVAVALGVGVISTRLREAGAGQERLVVELRQERLQAADILQNIRSGIVTVDERGSLRFANSFASTLLGIELDGEIGRPVVATIHPHAPELARVLQRAIELGVRTTRAEGVITAGGRSFPIGVTTTLNELEDGGGVMATAIFQDLSDSKRLEALNLRAQRLEAVAELSASLAHEIKNPLASIRSATEQLAQMASAGEDEQVLATLITRESDRLARLLSEFLDFARVRVTRVQPLDLRAVARGAAQLAAAHPDLKAGARVRCATPDGPIVIEGDEDLLHRAVFNLALNAVQAAPEGGQVLVEVLPMRRDELPDGLPEGLDLGDGAVAIRVSDDGAGIDAEVRDRLFDPFITTKPGGTGLGLPVVHRAIEAHRGLVFVDSTEHGTCFTVLLPHRQPDPASGGPE